MRLPSYSTAFLGFASSALAFLYAVIALFAAITVVAFVAWVLGHSSVRWDVLRAGWAGIGISVLATVLIDRVGRIKIKRRRR